MEKNKKKFVSEADRSMESSYIDEEQEDEDQDNEENEEWELNTEMGFSLDGEEDSYLEEGFFEPHPSNASSCNVSMHKYPFKPKENENGNTPSADIPMHKYPFKLTKNEFGNILTLHHTIKNVEQQLRIRIGPCGFNEMSNQMVVIDRRGNIFVFDFVSKRYWRLSLSLPQATLVYASPLQRNEFIVADELGYVYLLDVEKSKFNKCNHVTDVAIDQISWGNRLESSRAPNALMRFGSSAALLNLKTLKLSYQMDFNQSHDTLKFASFIPHSDQFFTCYTNDSIHIWSSHTLQTLKISQPIKVRDRKLRLLRPDKSIPEIVLHCKDDDEESIFDDEVSVDYDDYHFADGNLVSYCFSPNGNKLCLSTLDGYLMLLTTATLDQVKLFRLRDFILKQMQLLPQPKERILFAITERGMAIMLDLEHTDLKLIVQRSNAVSVTVSRDGKLLSVVSRSGEVNVWSTCRLYNSLHAKSQCVSQLRAALKQPKLPCRVNGSMSRELRQLLKRDRLEAMLAEYGCYPEKYRFLIWSSLLDLPSNGAQFQELLKLGVPAVIKHQEGRLKIKSDAQKRSVIKVWSCLAHWCKVFGYVDFMPHLVFPFIKHLPKNGLVVFELLVTLMLNHLQLCFEFHPMPPGNYLALCENLLQLHDEQLSKFYLAMDVKAEDFAWSLVTNGFSEVLEEQQWLSLWDNIFTEQPYFIVFVIVAYNMMHREVILRLPDKEAVLWFFHEQNPTDVTKWMQRSRKLMKKSPPNLHPQRFLTAFAPIPKGVYPKFLKYPTKWIEKQEEQTVELVKQHQEIDARIRHLELEELKVMERLENGIKQEEHTRRLKDMDKIYQETIQREEERIACHRKMLLTYHLEVRQRKSEIICKMQESEQRRIQMEMQKEINQLMHSVERERRRQNQEMQFAEDEIRNQEMELLAQRYLTGIVEAPLAQKYYENIHKMCRERDRLQQHLREMTMESMDRPMPSSARKRRETHITQMERSILKIQKELSQIISSESSG